MTETIHTLIIGGGQAGVATSTHLQKLGVPHLVLERGYAWLSDTQGAAVTSCQQLVVGQAIKASLFDGTVDLTVADLPG